MSAVGWREAPDAAEASPTLVVTVACLVVIALAAPVAAATNRSGLAGAGVAAAGSLALLGGWYVSRRPARNAIWLAAGLAAAVAAGPIVGVWLAIALALAWWVCLDGAPVAAFGAVDPGVRPPEVVLALAAAALMARDGRPERAVVLVVLACALPFLNRIGGGILGRAMQRIGSVAGGAVAAVCFTALGVGAVLVPWLYQRAFRLDPLSTRAGWERRRRRDVQAETPWAPDPALDPAPPAATLRRNGALAISLLVLAMAIPTTRRAIVDAIAPDGEDPKGFQLAVAPTEPELPKLLEPVPNGVKAAPHKPGQPFAAHANDPWFNDPYYSAPSAWGFDPKGAWRTIDPHRLLDFRSKWVNMVDGHRATWSPPPCSCRRLRVWVYGGSTTFGLDQRDDHTIPSELARVAYDHGIVLDVSNRGLSGHLNWMEAEHLTWDLTQEEAPDLVIMYDGVNDVWSTASINGTVGDTKPMVDPTSFDLWKRTKRSAGPVPKGPPGARLLTPPTPEPLPTFAYSRLVVKRYDESRRISQNSARVHGFAIEYFWQPTRVSRPLVLSEPHLDTEGENGYRLQQQVQVDLMPKDVHTMEDAFDSTTAPLFVDDVHHNELGAHLVAEEMYGKLAPVLKKLAGTKR